MIRVCPDCNHTYDEHEQTKLCPHHNVEQELRAAGGQYPWPNQPAIQQIAPTPLPKKKQFLRIVLQSGMVFDMPTPDDFNLIAAVMSVRSTGYFLNEHFYQPIEDIVTMFVWSEEKAPQPGESIVIPFPTPKAPA